MDEKELNHIRRTVLNDLLVVTSGCKTLEEFSEKINDRIRELLAQDAERERDAGRADTLRRIKNEF